MVCVAADVPTGVLAKASVVGDSTACGDVPVPESERVCDA